MKHDYHDATLIGARLLWEQQAAELEFRLSSDKPMTAVVAFEGLREFSWSQRFPWGESVSVNEVEVSSVGEETAVSIEMQSGDVITIKALGVSERN